MGALLLALLLPCASATVFLITKDNVTFGFQDADAAFGGMIPPMGMQGVLRQAIPFDGCSALDNPVDPYTAIPQFALILRGNCQFDLKVLNAQLAGYAAAIIYDDQDEKELITMSGRHLWDIQIPAVFVTLDSGRQMLSLLEKLDTICFLTPAFDNAAWSIMTASFLSLLALCSVLTLFMYIRRARFRELAARMLEREPLGMSASEVKAMPELVFRTGASESSGLETCAICLEDYEEEETLRLLPCRHGFHAACIDQWLMTRSPCCPVCKRDCKERGEHSGASQSLVVGTSPQIPQRTAAQLWFIPSVPERLSFAALFGGQGALETPLLPVTNNADDSSSSDEEDEEDEELVEEPEPAPGDAHIHVVAEQPPAEPTTPPV